jgi:hypothetical protein
MGVPGPPSKAAGVLSPATSEVVSGVELHALNSTRAVELVTINRHFMCLIMAFSFAVWLLGCTGKFT